MLIFGVNLDKVKNFKEDGIKELTKLYIFRDGSTLYDDYKVWIKDHFGKEYSDPEANIFKFLEDFSDSYGNSGLSGLLAAVIFKIEGLDMITETSNTYDCVGLNADMPWNYSKKVKDLSLNEYKNIMQKYVKMITDDVIEVCWHFAFDITHP